MRNPIRRTSLYRFAALSASVALVAGVLAALVLPAGASASTPAKAEPTMRRGPVVLGDHDGIHVVSSTWIDPRLVDVTVSTAALRAPVHVRILVPTGYAAHPARRYPSIYLLHGCAAGRPSNGLEYLEWSGDGAEQLTANANAIVVMPEAGGGGFYTDWFNAGVGGPPMWETFHIEQLLPWVDHSFRTIPDRSQRAIAGLSMGGFGSLTYASRHPDLFGAAASFSGAADLTNRPIRPSRARRWSSPRAPPPTGADPIPRSGRTRPTSSTGSRTTRAGSR